MLHLIFNEFIKNRTIQCLIILTMLFDLSLSQSLKHGLILFGLPYLTSIVLCYRYKPRKSVLKARISEQYRPVHTKRHTRE